MPARRFFLLDRRSAGETVAIEGADAHKIVDVLRLRAGDRIEVVDSASQLFDATIASVQGSVLVTLHAAREDAWQDALTIDVAQGIPKGQKMDFAIEKLTELGISTLIPLESERTVVRDLGASKLDRWRRLARTAAQQSGRRSVPLVTDPAGFDELCASFKEYDLVLFPWEVADAIPLREELEGRVVPGKRLLIVVGPEGGFSHLEAEHARSAGAHLVSLGPRILRTETAALVLVAILQYIVQ